MKKLIVLAVASLVATTANAAEMKWSGSSGWRYTMQTQNSGLDTKNAAGKDTSKLKSRTHEVRANLGVSGGWENVEWGVGVRTTGSTNAAKNDYATLSDNADLGIGFEQAWFRYLRDFGSMDMSVTVGRQKNVLAYDSVSQNFFDKDVRWDGFGWNFKFGMFGMNAAQYILGGKSQNTEQASTISYTDATDGAANTQSKFNYLLAFQPYMNWKFTDEIEAMFAVGYYLWSDNGLSNTTDGGVSAAGWDSAAGTASTINMNNSKQWQFLTTLTLPHNLSFNGELVMNKERPYLFNVAAFAPAATTTRPDASRSAWSLGLAYGALKKAHDFTVGYAYGSKGLGSVVNAYTSSSWAADNKGHHLNVGYSLADNFNLGLDAYFLKEKEKLDPATGLARTGGTSRQELSTTRWELTAGVMF